ncbi:MAG TPA: hypothetical protein VFI52_15910 [Gemmatimonadaceae bacterium]|nr:hypothetical protein [Gemmatimonadaceae bacterium]
MLTQVANARAAACAAVDRYADLVDRNRPLVGRLDERRSAERTMLSELHVEMGSYALALRKLGTPPQEALVLVKHLAESDSFQRVSSRSAVMLEVRSSLVDWFVEAYYSA